MKGASIWLSALVLASAATGLHADDKSGCITSNVTREGVIEASSCVMPFSSIASAEARQAFIKNNSAYPDRWSYWPAVILYIALAWLEIFGGLSPRQLSGVLEKHTHAAGLSLG